MRRPKFKVTITETLMRTVEVVANNQHEAEQMVSDDWHSSQTLQYKAVFIKEIEELTKVKKSTLYRNLPESKDKQSCLFGRKQAALSAQFCSGSASVKITILLIAFRVFRSPHKPRRMKAA